jgi:hypothetical protein
VRKRSVMLRRFLPACAFVGLLALFASHAAPAAKPTPVPSPSPTIDPVALGLFTHAKSVWHTRSDLPYLRYGALIRYLHNGHVFDNWWDVWARTSDGQLSMTRLVDVDEDRRRLSGIPFSIFGIKIFDTNPDSEPIRLDDPRLEPNSNFGVVSAFGSQRTSTLDAPPASDPASAPNPDPSASDGLRTIGVVEANANDYRISYVGIDQLRDGPADHLRLEPIADPKYYRLRDLWIDPSTFRTMQLRVAGILDGEPYNEVSWKIGYVELGGRNYLQQVVAEAPLRFGLDTVIPKFEIDLVDYHFPTEVPKYTFDKPFGF